MSWYSDREKESRLVMGENVNLLEIRDKTGVWLVCMFSPDSFRVGVPELPNSATAHYSTS